MFLSLTKKKKKEKDLLKLHENLEWNEQGAYVNVGLSSVVVQKVSLPLCATVLFVCVCVIER